MIVYQTDRDGYYLGPVAADESPLEPGVYLIPAGCATEPPPEVAQGKWPRLVDGVWAEADIPLPPPPPEDEEPEPPTLEEQRAVMSLTFAQLLIGLVDVGWITRQEGEGWLDGVLPAPVQALIAGLPEAQQFPALARAKRPSVVMRMDPLVQGLAAMMQKTPEELDGFFTVYAQV